MIVRSSIVLSVVLFSSCEREVFTGPPVLQTDGYEIRGFVLDPIGNPMPGVKVRVDYDLELEDMNDPPVRSVPVTNPLETFVVRIYTVDGHAVRTIVRTVTDTADFVYDWDELRENGTDAPSGAYWVTYLKGATEILRYPHLVRDNVVAVTDSVGHYVIPDESFPVGFYPVAVYSSNGTRFFGNYSVTSLIYLTFVPDVPITPIFKDVRVERDRVVECDVRFN